MCVSEANFKRKDREHYFNDFLGYKIETNLQYEKIGVSRNCILIREGLKYKRRMDLEDETNCDIWIELSSRGSKNTLICGSYRQWSMLKEMRVEDSGNIKNKSLRTKIH